VLESTLYAYNAKHVIIEI